VFRALDPDHLQTCFLNWIRATSPLIKGQVIAIDGKQLRRSHDEGLGRSAISMVSAWATANHLVLGQRKVAEKSNEITAIKRRPASWGSSTSVSRPPGTLTTCVPYWQRCSIKTRLPYGRCQGDCI
jgi:hypothetical protein